MKTILYATLLTAATLFPPMLCSAPKMKPLLPEIIEELEKTKQKYEEMIDLQKKEQQEITRYQIRTINLLLGLMENDSEYCEIELPILSITASINNYENADEEDSPTVSGLIR